MLGKAVPEQADTASTIVQLNSIATSSHVQFRGLELGQGGGSGSTSGGVGDGGRLGGPERRLGSSSRARRPRAGPRPRPPRPPGPRRPGASTTGSTTATPASSTGATSGAAPATEDAASTQPIGAVVGPAGLPTLPYKLTFTGGFFDIADFIGGVDDLVTLRHGTNQVAANGRLFTVDGFALNGGAPGASPQLEASFLVTTYVVPADRG